MSETNRRKYAMANLQRVSTEQWLMLLGYMESHRSLANVSTNLGATFNQNIKTEWDQLAERLNADTNFPRTSEQWRKYWCNRRSAVKRKAEKQLDDGRGTVKLAADEMKILEIVGISQPVISDAKKKNTVEPLIDAQSKKPISFRKIASKSTPPHTSDPPHFDEPPTSPGFVEPYLSHVVSNDQYLPPDELNEQYLPLVALNDESHFPQTALKPSFTGSKPVSIPLVSLPTPTTSLSNSIAMMSSSKTDFTVSKHKAANPTPQTCASNNEVPRTDASYLSAGDNSNDTVWKEYECQSGNIRISSDSKIFTKKVSVEQAVVTSMHRLGKVIEETYKRLSRKQFCVTFQGSDGDETEFVFISSSKTRRKTDIHKNVNCSLCRHTIAGFRYKCTVCRNFDLCTACEALGSHSQHIILRISTPVQLTQAEKFLQGWPESVKHQILQNHEQRFLQRRCESVPTAETVAVGDQDDSTRQESRDALDDYTISHITTDRLNLAQDMDSRKPNMLRFPLSKKPNILRFPLSKKPNILRRHESSQKNQQYVK